jgi:serine protease Do
MKTKPFLMIATAALLPLTSFAQTPPAPPAPPAPPSRPDTSDEDNAPKMPVTFLGVETSEVPSVLCEQMNLPKGFGLVVDYVVPNGPAAAAGVQQNDILKMLNDQILMEPDQLGKLVRSFSDGTNVTLTILRKGTEQKVTVKLGKREVRQRRHRHAMHGFDNHFDFGNAGNFNFDMSDLRRQLESQKGIIREAVERARAEAMRAKDEALRAAREWRVRSTDAGGAMRTTRIDLGKAQIVFSDDQGEIKIESVDGKKVLTAKDPKGQLIFSGPIDTEEERAKIPPAVRQRFDKLEEKDLPKVPMPPDAEEPPIESTPDSFDQISYQPGHGFFRPAKSVWF